MARDKPVLTLKNGSIQYIRPSGPGDWNTSIGTPLLPFCLLDRVALLIRKSLGLHDLDGIVERIQLRLRCSVGAEIRVGPGKVLSVVDSEVHVMQRVMRGAVDEFLGPVTCDHVAVVDEDGPDLNGHKESQV